MMQGRPHRVKKLEREAQERWRQLVERTRVLPDEALITLCLGNMGADEFLQRLQAEDFGFVVGASRERLAALYFFNERIFSEETYAIER